MRDAFNTVAEHVSDVTTVRIDRDRELDRIFEALVRRKQNVLLYGTRGVGKTFLLRLVEKQIQELAPEVYPCIVNVASIAAYSPRDEAAGFPRAVLLQFCAALWKLLGRSYMDLRSTLDESGQELKLTNAPERAIQRVYTHLMLQEREIRHSLINSVGFAAGLKGEKKEDQLRSGHQPDVLPFEFAEFTEELVATVLQPNGRQSVIFLCDEANHMPIFKQEQLLDRYLELFSAKRVQFVFVAGFCPNDEKHSLPSCFETHVELVGFPEKRMIQQLILSRVAEAGPECPTFGKEVIDILFEAYSGHPRLTLEACYCAHREAMTSGQKEISPSLIVRMCRELDGRRKTSEAGLP